MIKIEHMKTPEFGDLLSQPSVKLYTKKFVENIGTRTYLVS
jgi:hypothetical protein